MQKVYEVTGTDSMEIKSQAVNTCIKDVTHFYVPSPSIKNKIKYDRLPSRAQTQCIVAVPDLGMGHVKSFGITHSTLVP